MNRDRKTGGWQSEPALRVRAELAGASKQQLVSFIHSKLRQLPAEQTGFANMALKLVSLSTDLHSRAHTSGLNGTRMAVAITIPHGYCDLFTQRHGCDWLADKAGRTLHDELPGSTLFAGQTPRRQADLNRTEGKDVDFRPAYSAWLKEQTGRFGVVDVHSFSSTGDSWSDEEANRADLVFLTTMPSRQEDQVVSALRAKGFHVRQIAGHPTVNAIVLEARQRGAAFAMLLEWNESLSDSRLRSMCRTIADVLQDGHLGARMVKQSPSNGDGKAILALSAGVVERITESDAYWHVRIYLSPKDHHELYAPVAGRIVDIQAQHGTWKRPVFTSWELKTGRLHVWIEAHGKQRLGFWVEVGSGYITDTVHVDADVDDTVSQAQRLGEIVIGSLAEVQIPKSWNVRLLVRVGQVLLGGQTMLAELPE